MTFPFQLQLCRGMLLHLSKRALLMLAILGTWLGGQPLAYGQSKEYALKAAFLFHFTQFVEWPAEAFAETNSPFVIAILGVDPFGKVLEDLIEKEKVKGRFIVVRRYRSLNEVEQPHILYISQSESSNMDRIIRVMRGRPVLTVSDLDHFAVRGGMIRFLTEKNKIRFRINNEVAQREGLTISSKLLRLAELVPEK